MKILLFLHDVVLGGTTVNAVELACSLRDQHDHEVIFFGTPGPMCRLLEEHGMRFLPAPLVHHHPSPSRMQALREAVRKEKPDLVYAWETWPCFDTYYGVHLPMGIPMLLTDMQMFVTHRLPTSVITTFGTPELVAIAKAQGRRRVELLLPPVDVQANAPGKVDPSGFCRRWGIQAEDINLVIVSRLVESMKGDGLNRAIQAVRTLGPNLPVRLIVVGDGAARSHFEKLANEVNSELGRCAVVLTGAMLDPRAAYAAADIVIGMGGSSLRGMAFGKPVIVVGERGFSAPFTPESAEYFYHKGLYGEGNGLSDNSLLVGNILRLAELGPQKLKWLGEFSRDFVVQRYSLDVVAARLADICRKAVEEKPSHLTTAIDVLRTTGIYMRERAYRFCMAPQATMKIHGENQALRHRASPEAADNHPATAYRHMSIQ